MKRPITVAISIALLFGAACAAFGLSSPQIWNSPDETAVAFFSKTLSEHGRLWAFEPTNLFGGGVVHPRSIISFDSNLVPGSFYGAMFYFAVLYKAMGAAAFSIGAPLLTALSSLAVFFSLRKLYGARTALFGQVLFWANPAVWYFTSRGLYPNIIFLDSAIIGLAILYLRPWKKFAAGRGNEILERSIDDFAGISFLGFAFLVRPVEFIWLAPVLAALVWRARKSITWPRAVSGAFVSAAFAALLLFVNKNLYGSFLSFGYTAGSTMPGISVPAASATSRLPDFISAPRPFILPFGFHPRSALTNLWNYVVVFAWWLPLLAAAGLLLSRERKNRRPLARAFLWVSLAVGVYYGSGIFVDSSVSQWTIGSSYLRYFLPATILLVPFAAQGLEILRTWKKAAAWTALGAFIALGAWTVYYRSPEALIPMRRTLIRYAEIKETVLKETQPEDVIITERSDKIFFPDRRVAIGLREQSTLDDLPRLVQAVGVYYYGITISEGELPAINARLHERGLQLGRIKAFGNETLYGITKER